MRRATSALLAGALLGFIGCSDDGPPDAAPEEPPVAVAEWPTAGLDLANSRAAAGSRITSETIDDLEEAWRADLPDAGGLSTVPIVVDGVAYVQGGATQVVAVDVETGEVEWSTEPFGGNIGPFGVAVDETQVYALDGSAGVVALDRDDGARVWAVDVTPTDTIGIDIQPIVVGELVLVSSVPVSAAGGIYAPGDRGVIYALDRSTGAVEWSFDTVEGDLWGHPEVNSGGGAWYPPAVDEDRGLVYVGVANPAPFPGTPEYPNGSSRPGDNLYTNSLVALDLASGQLRWFHQVVPHDIFDRDQIHALIAEVGGEDVVVSAGKSGMLVGLDPDDGTVRWDTSVGRHENDDLEELDGPTVVYPGTFGGILTPPATADGVVYAAVLNAPATLSPAETAYFGADLGTADGEVVAVDGDDGRVLWSTAVPGDPLGGATVVGDLVVTALLDGTLIALRRTDGEIVWTHAAGGGVNGWLAALDDRLIIPVGMSQPASLLALALPEG